MDKLEKPSVLIVDDAKIMQDILAEFLEKEGFDIVAFADDGKDAIEKYKQFKPDLVTMDLDMPVMSGELSSKKILSFDNQAKILMVSAHSDRRIKQDIIAHGIRGYITKPFKKEILIDEVNFLLASA